MLSFTTVEMIPVWIFFPLMIVITLASIEVGFRIGRRHSRTVQGDSMAPVGTAVGAALGLLAFIIAFTFGMTASRYDTRKQLLLADVNAIGTAYLRADLQAEPLRTQTRQILREYVEIRADVSSLAHDAVALKGLFERCQVLQNQLWQIAISVVEQNRSSPVYALFIESLNDVFDVHTKRMIVVHHRIPPIIWMVLLLVSIVVMSMVGFQFGAADTRRVHISVTLALTFSAVFMLIHDLDNPYAGTLVIDQQPMIDLRDNLKAQADAELDKANLRKTASPGFELHLR